MPGIVTVTFNPALDIATTADRVVPGKKLRCTAPVFDPGGGGINVSRVIARLGGDSTLIAALGGPTGDRLANLLQDEGLTFHRLPAPGETREGMSVTDRSTGEQYRFVLPGPTWKRRQIAAALDAIAAVAGPGDYLVLSGSMPPGAPADLPARLAAHTARRGIRIVLDTSGPCLTASAAPKRPVHVLRMDDAEAEVLAGRTLATRADTAAFAQTLVGAGAADMVVIARGADGSVLATRDDRFFAQAAKVPVISKIGAGDSFLGAFTLALWRGKPPARALQEGVAAASAAVMTEATDLCRVRDARRLIAACPVSAL
jgi:6-phosphofructokinase 2